MTDTKLSLYERLGGAAAVGAAVELFYNKVTVDPLLAPFFAGVDLADQRRKMAAFMTFAFVGSGAYAGKDLRAAHRPLVRRGLGDSRFDRVAAHLAATLVELGVPAGLSA